MITVNALLVDDEFEINEIVGDVLTGLGYTYKSATSVKDALDLLQVYQPDLIVCDVFMPGTTGLQFIEKLRMSGNFVPVVMLTACDFQDIIDHAKKLGALDYLLKPFKCDVLQEKISFWIEFGKLINQVQQIRDEKIKVNLLQQLKILDAMRKQFLEKKAIPA